MKKEIGTCLYYFTGTGNTFSIAQKLQKHLPAAELKCISKTNLNEKIPSVKRIGILYPVYYEGIPRIVEKFLKKIEISGNPYIFAVADFGHDSGISFCLIDSYLKEKGHCLNACFGMEMPGNMWSLYYPHSKEVVTERLETEEVRVRKIIKKIIAGTIIPIESVIDSEQKRKKYNSFHPQNADNSFWVNERCISCSKCSSVCPSENITMENGFPVWHHNCEQCLACFHRCPQRAIEIKADSIQKERYTHPVFR